MANGNGQATGNALGALRRLLWGQPSKKIDGADAAERELGYVETGDETVDFLVTCIRDGRHAMLVGPRGTGKSFMGAKAVRKAEVSGDLGVVQRIEIQGDPNKPPSDYFDDSISFSKQNERLVPSMINAPFFRLANKVQDTNEFECHPGPEKRIILRKKLDDGSIREVDRVVIYWDEGNRSSPAMLNAVLGLLAEGRLRRDGVAYTFPPVSCILTRNPDGYDANSAKMPSPLIDRFGVQFYVYNPSIETFVATIAPEFLRRQRVGLLRESFVAVSGVADESKLSALRNAIGRTLKSAESSDSPTTDGVLLERVRKIIGMYEADPIQNLRAERCKILDRIAHAAAGRSTDEGVSRFVGWLRKVLGDDWADFARVLDETWAAAKAATARDQDSKTANGIAKIRQRLRSVSAPDPFEALDSLEFLDKTINRLRRMPADGPEYRKVAARLAVVVLATWGDRREVSKKPGMQYLPPHAKEILEQLAKEDHSVAAHLRTVGELTRYGTSIRAFEEMLKALLSPLLASDYDAPNALSTKALDSLRKQLGGLLGHRCETAFNPDREPSKALEKSRALLWLARWVLGDDRATRIVELTGLEPEHLGQITDRP